MCLWMLITNQYEVEKENLGESLNYLEDGYGCEMVFL